jgi:hypothetical protein
MLDSIDPLERKDAQEARDAVMDRFGPWLKIGLSDLCSMFGLEKGGDKETVIARIVDYLKRPYNTGKKTMAEKKTKTRVHLPIHLYMLIHFLFSYYEYYMLIHFLFSYYEYYMLIHLPIQLL